MAGRIFSSVKEAVDEVERELFEMGIRVAGHSYQDKVVKGDGEFITTELQAYNFTITSPDSVEALEVVVDRYGQEVADWAWAEFEERVGLAPKNGRNPGRAWERRREVWEQFLEKGSGRFSYTYGERMLPQLDSIIKELKKHPATRQAIIEIHNNLLDIGSLGGRRRMPCSMFYQLMIRNGGMDLIYTMRSSDFLTHFCNDLALAVLLQDWVRTQVGNVSQGNFTMFIGSLHAFKKDMTARGIF